MVTKYFLYYFFNKSHLLTAIKSSDLGAQLERPWLDKVHLLHIF